MDSTVDDQLKTELQSVQNKWHGGYWEGQPLHPLATSPYNQVGFVSILHATYLHCIKPYITPETVSLEIGPGRGAWTQCLLPSKEVYALDALSAEHNNFFSYLGYPTHVKYFQVSDFECEMLPDNHFDYMFSHGCLCHVSFDGMTRYANRIYPKMKSGSNCFWMVGDSQKYNAAYLNYSIWDALERIVPAQGRPLVAQLKQMWAPIQQLPPGQNEQPGPGLWYAAGGARTCAMLASAGYKIVDADVGTNVRDPIIHFRKP
jgi:hypothetical protein